ncbi:MAG TPA: hypothetical protein DC054_05220 [Blastocatellia bacterium]|nr:hypothetical protein [Blastocatellia bacterium]
MSSSGNWHDVKQYAAGMKVDTFGTVGVGVFAKREGENKVNFLSSYDAPRPVLPSDLLQKNADLLRTETVLGYPAFVTKANNNPQMEFYKAPIIGGDDIKLVDKSETYTVVIEPTSLVPGEPDASLLKTPADLPVSYENFDKVHAK